MSAQGRVFPPGTCDTHIHVYDDRFPVAPAAVLRPPNASLDAHAVLRRELGIDRVVIVQPTTYGVDNRCQLEAVERLGDAARAVVVVDETATDAELERLTEAGARGARFHMLPGGAVPWSSLLPTARRIQQHGWHIQLQLDGRELADRAELLRSLPCPLVIDHVGRFMPPVDPGHASFRSLLTLLDHGSCWVKLSAPYESTRDDAPDHPGVTALARRLVAHAPERTLWASNWPHPGQTDPPDHARLRQWLYDWIDDDAVREMVLVHNPAELYGFPEEGHDDN